MHQFSKEIGKLTATIKDQTKQYEVLRNEFNTLKGEYADLRDSVTNQVEGLKADIPLAINAQLLGTSYASVSRTTPINQSLPNQTAMSISYRTATHTTEPLYCTIDTSRVEEDRTEEMEVGTIRGAIEKEMRKAENQEKWKCVAAMRDLRNTGRIRIACRNEEELQAVKKAVENAGTLGLRVLRDQLFLIKIDSVNRTAVLDNDGCVRIRVMEKISKENDVKMEKLAWLSKRDNFKAYGSMLVYLTRNSDVQRLLQEEFFHIGGESATTAPFTPFSGPIQCYKCQEIGHKSFKCQKT
jgi:DNA gyrase/topoisomerase IV subunit A